MHSLRLGSAPQLRSVFPRGRRRHLQRLPLSGLRSQPRTLSINAFGKMYECGGEDTTACTMCQDRFWPLQMTQVRIRHLKDAELRAWPIAATYA
jgi:hypothetical protein